MGKIFGQRVPLTMVHNALSRDELHHSLLMHGSDSCGKFESALNIAKTIHCQAREKLGFCDKCPSCVDIHLLRHPDLLVLSNDSRSANISFYLHLLKEGLTAAPKRIFYQLLGEIALLLNRHKTRYLNILAREKVSFPEGRPLKSSEMETVLARTYRNYENLQRSFELGSVEPAELAADLEKLQNSLDRSIITKDTLTRLQNQLTMEPARHRIVIIQNIDRLMGQVVGGFLKLLEEPPARNTIILITRSLKEVSSQVIVPLKSRCFELNFKPLNGKMLRNILEKKFQLKEGSYDLEAGGEYEGNISEIMSSLVSGHRLKKSGLDAGLLEIFNKKGYNLSVLADRIIDSELEFPEVLAVFRGLLGKTQPESGRKSGGGAPILPKLKGYQVRKAFNIIDMMDSINNTSNISKRNLVYRLLLGMQKSYI